MPQIYYLAVAAGFYENANSPFSDFHDIFASLPGKGKKFVF